jgi:hypothetical protein
MPRKIDVMSGYMDGRERRLYQRRHPSHITANSRHDEVTLKEAAVESNKSKPLMYIPAEDWERIFGRK